MATENFDRETFDTAIEITKLVRDATGLCCGPLANLTWETYQTLRQGKGADEQVTKSRLQGGEDYGGKSSLSTEHQLDQGNAGDSTAGAERQT